MKNTIGHICLSLAMVLAISSCKSKKGAEDLVSEASISEEKFASAFFDGQREKAINNPEKAYMKFQSCAEMNPNEDVVYYELAKLDTLNGNFGIAIANINKAAELSPENLWYKRLKADVELATGDLDGAMKTLQNISQAAPNDVKYRQKLAQLAIYNGDSKTALMAFNEIERYSGVSESLTRKKYTLLISEDRTDEAVQELKKLSDAYPNEPAFLRNLATHYQKYGQNAQASDIYEQILDLNPRDGSTHLALSKFYLESGQLEKIGNSLIIGFEDDQAPVETKLAILNTLVESNESNIDATELLDILQKTHPENGESWKLGGDLAAAEGDSKKATEYYLKALKNNPNDIELWLKVNSEAAKGENYTELKKVSDDALAYFPTEPRFYLYKGQALIQQGQSAKAIKTLTSGKDFIIGNDALTSRFDLQIGKAHFELGEFDLAQNWFEKALTHAGVNMGSVQEHLGDAFFQQENKTKALEFWNKAKSSGGASSLIEEKIANEKYISQ